jgi:hypothetical protein
MRPRIGAGPKRAPLKSPWANADIGIYEKRVMTHLTNADGPLGEERKMVARAIRNSETPSRGLPPAYVMELRRLIRDDAYNSVPVADEIARRIMRSGDM